ncbi:hypothetical protein HQ560_03855, partial [bacterium]|nr:hypothetical protein [bacterium]
MNMKMRSVAVFAIMAVWVGAVVPASGGGLVTPLTLETREGLGAAAYVPDDVAVYSSAFRLLDQWTRIWQSNAVQSLARTPLAQYALAWVQMNPFFRQAQMQLQQNPFVIQMLPVLKDAMSNEVFVCAGPESVQTLGALLRIIQSVQRQGVRVGLQGGDGPGQPDVGLLLQTVLAEEQHLRMPSVLMGGKLKNAAAATQFLDLWMPQIPPTPVGKVEKKAIRGANFYVLDFKGSSLPPEVFADLARELARAKIAPGARSRLIEFLMSQRVVVAVGILDDYLMMAVGRDLSALDTWGARNPLAAAPALEPARKLYRPGLTSIGYSSEALYRLFTPTREGMTAGWGSVKGLITAMKPPQGLAERLDKDVARLIEKIELPVPRRELTLSFDNKGSETFVFGGALGALDHSEPLAILAHRGKNPILSSASHAAPNPGVYVEAVEWIKIGFGYFSDYAVPTMDKAGRKEYEKGMKFVLPFLDSIDKTTRECIVPSIDGVQSVCVIDGGGSLARVPGVRAMPVPFPIPRIGLATQLNDPVKFKQGMRRYMAAARKLIADIQTAYPRGGIPTDFRLRSPMTEAVAGGTLYYYRIPGELGNDVLPCALLKGNLLVLSTSGGLAGEMVEARPMPGNAVVPLDRPIGAASIVDARRAWKYLQRVSDTAFTVMMGMGRRGMRPAEQQQAMVIKMHVDILWRALGAIRGYASSTTVVDGETVT